MKQFIILVGALLTMWVAPTQSRAQAVPLPPTEETILWSGWGGAPYASTFAEACRKSREAITGMNLPEDAKADFIRQLGTTCAGGREVWLTPDSELSQMWSGGSRPHIMNNVTVAELPVLRAPSGRPYRAGAVAQTARALEWTYTSGDGTTYRLILPFVCFNWSWAPVEAPEMDCVEVSFDTRPGTSFRWGLGTTFGALAPSLCNAQKDGNGSWKAWSGECDECVPAYAYIRQTLGASATVPHRYFYTTASGGRQTIRMSRQAWNAMFYVCLEYQGARSCGVYIPPGTREGAWNGRRSIHIEERFFVRDNGNCPA